MHKSLLSTKLFIPPSSAIDLVGRQRLIEQLNRGIESKLILISAPAGFGKSTLISEWTRTVDKSVTWLSLDENDNNVKRLFSHLIAAFQKIEKKIGETILPSLESTDSPPLEPILTTLINDIAASDQEFYIVLDDFHEITKQAIHEGVDFFIENLPINAHLVICSRIDPAISLARYRARGQMTEIRSNDLRFSEDEIVSYLNDIMELGLSTSDISAMLTRTEGWITGIKLAAISMQGRRDKHEFVSDFSGSHHYIIDYLIDEVLVRQPIDTKNFLLQTSVLGRFNAPLADFVLGIEKSVSLIQSLDKSNLFLIPLDDEGNWYRFHHLFAEFLKQRITKENPADIPALHRKASEWLEEHNLFTEAIDHALAGKDFDRAAKLIEQIGPNMMMKSEFDQLSTWLNAIPRETINSWPWLCIIQAWMNQRWAKFEEAENYLQNAEKALESSSLHPPWGGSDVINGQVAAIRALLALNKAKIPESINYAQQALELLPSDHFNRAVASLCIGVAQRNLGNFAEAQDVMVDARRESLFVGNHILAQAIVMHLGRVQALQGRLHKASQSFLEAVELTYPGSTIRIPYASECSVLLANIYREQNDLNLAMEYVNLGIEIGKPAQMVDALAKGYATRGRIFLAQNKLDLALEECRKVERMVLDVPDLEPEAITMALDCQIRILLAEDNVLEAERVVREKGFREIEEIVHFDDLDQIVHARVLIYSGRASGEKKSGLVDAERLLSKINEAARSVACYRVLIETNALLALTYQAQGKHDKASESLTEAISLAKHEGFVRVFIDEGHWMKELLASTAFSANEKPYIENLLTSFAKEEAVKSGKDSGGLIDPLSKRELEVIRLLSTELSGPDIAKELVVSLNTVRTHTKNIYSKLGVNNRRAAIKQAELLNLI